MELSLEEKKAIENVKDMFEDISLEELIKNKDINVTIYSSGILDILRVIGIVERQQKEIEELKEKSYKCEYLEEGAEEIIKNSISKDKIREIIKELKNMNVEGELFTTAVNYTIKILEELLEEET